MDVLGPIKGVMDRAIDNMVGLSEHLTQAMTMVTGPLRRSSLPTSSASRQSSMGLSIQMRPAVMMRESSNTSSMTGIGMAYQGGQEIEGEEVSEAVDSGSSATPPHPGRSRFDLTNIGEESRVDDSRFEDSLRENSILEESISVKHPMEHTSFGQIILEGVGLCEICC